MMQILKVMKGHNYIKSVVKLRYLFSVYYQMMLNICTCTKFHENISKGIRVIEWTQFEY